MFAFAKRTLKEIIRDPLTVFFGIGFPVVLMLLLSLIQSNIPVELFNIDRLSPGIAVFGLSFIALFSGLLVAKDRSSSFMLRMFTSPLRASDFIIGYCMPMLPVALAQTVVCFITAIILGLDITLNILLTIAVTIPAAVVFISLGLLFGSIFNDKQVGGICGALLTNLSAWLSGTWFDLDLVGGWFKSFANALPFARAVNAGRAALTGNYGAIMPELIWVIGYAVVLTVIAVLVFNKKISSDN